MIWRCQHNCCTNGRFRIIISKTWPNGVFLLLKYTNLSKMILNFQMDRVVLRQKQSLHQRKGQRESQLMKQLLRDVLDERENVNYLRLCQDPFQIRKNQNNDFHAWIIL